MIADYFFLHKDVSKESVNFQNLLIWLVGFILYRLLMRVDTPVGNTLPDMLLTLVLCLLVGAFCKHAAKASNLDKFGQKNYNKQDNGELVNRLRGRCDLRPIT